MSIYSGHFEYLSYSACNLTASEASRTNIDVTRGTVNDRLYTLYIGLPCTIGTSVRMADFNTKGNALIAKLALCHVEAPP